MQLFINGLIAGSLAALLAGGLALVYGVLGVFNMALGQTVLVGGYVAWWFAQVVGLPMIVSIGLGLGFGGVLAWFTFEVFVVPFYRRHRFLPLVTTIAWSLILDGLILLLFEERPRSLLAGLPRMMVWGGARVSPQQGILVFCTLFFLCMLAFILHATAFGRRIRAVVSHPEAALSLGIPSPVLHRLIFVVSGVLAAAGGVFIGIDQNLTPTLAFPLTIKAYAAVIAGGKGNVWGAILCAYLIALVEQFVVGIRWFGLFYIPSGYQATVALLVIILFLLWRPQGLFASSQRAA